MPTAPSLFQVQEDTSWQYSSVVEHLPDMYEALDSTLNTGGRKRGWGTDQQIRVLGTKREDLSLIPRTHTTEGKNQGPQAVLWPLHIHHDMSRHTHTTH